MSESEESEKLFDLAMDSFNTLLSHTGVCQFRDVD